MKRANKSGSIYKLSGKRRKPWAVQITKGYTDDGKQIREMIGTYATKSEATEALSRWLYVPEKKTSMTVAEAWQGWCQQYTGKESTIGAYRSAYNRLARLHNTALEDLTLDMMQAATEEPPHTYNTASTVKKVLSAILDYGFAHDACPASRRELLQYIHLPERTTQREINTFTDDEIQECIDQKAIGAVILLFTGLRREELLTLKREDIHLDEQWLHVSKSKTKAGIRDVPIPDGLVPFVRSYIESGSLGHSTSFFYTHHWKEFPVLDGHTRHECRHTYVTRLGDAHVDQRLIKMLVGHTGTITEDIYTHIPMSKKLEVVNEVFGPLLPKAPTDSLEDISYELQA